MRLSITTGQIEHGECGQKAGQNPKGEVRVYSRRREKAARLFEKCGQRIESVIRILGYPSPNYLQAWYSEWVAAGRVHEDVRGKFTRERKEVAIEFWRTHNFSIKEMIEALGCRNCQELCAK